MLHALARRARAGQCCLHVEVSRQAHRGVCTSEAPLSLGSVFETRRAFSASDVAQFAALTGDSNPIHSDAVRGLPPCAPKRTLTFAAQAAARKAGLDACATPGLLAASLFPAIIGSRLVRSSVSRASASLRHALTHAVRVWVSLVRCTCLRA